MGVELEINNSSAAKARYVGYAPAPCRVRQTGGSADLSVKLKDGGTVGKITFYGGGASPATTGTADLALTLPQGGGWVSFWMGGIFGSPSRSDGDAGLRVEDAAGAALATVSLMVRIRKNANLLSVAERNRFLKALGTLNNQGKGAFQTLRDMHVAASDEEAHGAPGFLPWHRAYVLDLERRLQALDPSVTVPYWRFDQPAPNVFIEEFMGQTPKDKAAVKFAAGNPLSFWKTDQDMGVLRRPLFDTTLNGADVINEAQTLALGASYDAFRNLEEDPHGAAHVSFLQGGFITRIPTAAKDPLFFLLHCNVDRLWAKWQWLRKRFDTSNADSYDTNGATRIGHHLPDTMWPWNGATTDPRPNTAPGGGLPDSPCTNAPGKQPKVASMFDYQGRLSNGARLGYDYDDVPYP